MEALREGIVRVWNETINVPGKKLKLAFLGGTIYEIKLGAIFIVPGVMQWES